MDVMELRRRLIVGMASGRANFISGTVTIASDWSLQFGKTFHRYIFFFEMTEESKTRLLQTEQNGARAYAIIGIYPPLQINDVDTNYPIMYQCINPYTKNQTIRNDNRWTRSETHIKPAISSLENSVTANALYIGKTYNYYVVSLDDM